MRATSYAITIYRSPSDHPDKFVARVFITNFGPEPIPTDRCAIVDTLEQARDVIPAGWLCFPRAADDDPVIVETWM